MHRAVLLAPGPEIEPEAIRLPDGTQVGAATQTVMPGNRSRAPPARHARGHTRRWSAAPSPMWSAT